MEDFKPLILIADDEPSTVDVARIFLADPGYRFIEASDGGQTVQIAREQRPDLILLDINMPVLDGFAVLEKLRQDPETSSIVVIVMTAAYGRREDRLRGFALGADDYILKPLDRRELAARVRSWLRVRRLENDLYQQRTELESLYHVAQAIASTLDPQKLVRQLMGVAGEAIGAEDGWVILVDENGAPLHAVRYGHTLSSQEASELARQSLKQGVGSVVSRTKTGLLIQDSVSDDRYATGELGLSRIRSIVSVPLLGRKHYRGILTYAHSHPGRFTERHLQWLRTAAGQAAVALDNAYLFAREQRRAVQFQLLNSVTQDMSSVLEMDRLLDVVVNLVQRTFSYYYVGLGLRQGEHMVIQAVALDEEGVDRSLLLGVPEEEGAVAWVAQHSRPLLLNDVTKDSRYIERPGLDATRSELTLPVHVYGETLGVLDVKSRRTNTFDPDDVVLLETLAAQVSIAIQNARLFKELSDQRERLNAVLNSVNNSVLVVDDDDRLLLVNPTARQLFDLTDDQLGLVVEPGVLPTPLCYYFTQPIPAGETLIGEYQSDDDRSFQVVAAPVAVDVGHAGRVVLLYDITHFKELSRLKDEFVATASHDLKNPLTVIQGASYWLDKPGIDEEKRVKLLASIRRAVGNMSNLVNQLLDLGKLESGMGISPANVDIRPLLEEIVEQHEGQVKKGLLTLSLKAPPELQVYADVDRVRQVLNNLLVNAIKYTPVGGAISVEATPQDDHVLFKVHDTGQGIPPRDQPYVFDKFYRGQSDITEHVEGTGLGLAIAKSVVRGHNGRIWLESTPGKGSTFFFTLPHAEEKD